MKNSCVAFVICSETKQNAASRSCCHVPQKHDAHISAGWRVPLGREAVARSANSPSLLSVRLLAQVTEKLLEVENETMMKVADLEKLLLHKDKELQIIRVSRQEGVASPHELQAEK